MTPPRINKRQNFFIAGIIGMTTTLMSLFFSGRIIDIPKGTREGGIVSAVGVGVILVIVFVGILIANWLVNKTEGQNEKQK